MKKDTTALPHLPARLSLPAPEPSETAAAAARGVAWRPELAWVLGARLTIGQVEQLQRVNVWLRDRSRDEDVLPLRERSLELLGDEKALDRLQTTSVFGPDRLTLSLLRTFRTHPPLASVKVSDGPVLLVVENDNTFFSIQEVLKTSPESRGAVGTVAWGCGGAFEASVRSIGGLPGIERVAYFGDVDPDGLRIPTGAAQTAAREGLPPVLPAIALYSALVHTTVRIVDQSPVTSEHAAALTSWMIGASTAHIDGAQVAAQVARFLEGGVRVPQEAVNLSLLRELLAAEATNWTDL